MKFHERFGITIDSEEAEKRFVNRIYNEVWFGNSFSSTFEKYEIEKSIVSDLGKQQDFTAHISTQVGGDFFANLRALESLYVHIDGWLRETLQKTIEQILSQSEIDLGIEWKDGQFYRKGAKLLDDKLVNDVLNWIQ